MTNGLMQMSEVSAVIEIATRGIEAAPEEPGNYLTRARGLMKLGQFEEALEDLLYAQDLAPDRQTQTSYGLAQAYIGLGRDDEAIEILEQHPGVKGCPIWSFQLACCYARSGQMVKALDPYNKAIRKDSDDARAHETRGLVQASAGEFTDALQDLDIAIMLAPRVTRILVNRARVHHMKGNYTTAVADCRQALYIDPDCVRAYAQLIDTYSKMDGYEHHALQASATLEMLLRPASDSN